MQEVTAFLDNSARLHRTKREAITSDFVGMMQTVWAGMPDQRDRGDPVVIGRIVASTTYPNVLVELLAALQWLNEQLKVLDD